MPSQFFGLEIGASALSAFQTSVNTTANNVANANTTGYTRQTATLKATDALRVYQRYGTCGTGVEVTEIKQERNLYYDEKYWTNNSSKGYFEQKLYSIDQIQTIFEDDENSQKGFSTIFASMFNALDTLKTTGEESETRNQFINQAQSLCTYFNQLSKSLEDIQDDCNEEIKTTVEQINAIGQKIAILNKQINQIEVRGGYANELRDQRALLVDDLSELVTVETKEFDVTNSNGQNLGGTNYRVYINGQLLVDGNDYRSLVCTSSEYSLNQSDITGLYYVTWSDTGNDFNATAGIAGGSLKALFDVRDGNNADNMKGDVKSAAIATNTDPATITITPYETYTDANALSLAQKGRVMINSTYYYYDGWTANTDAKGNITEVTFKLTGDSVITAAEAASLAGKEVVCGETVDSLGVPYYQAQINEFLRSFAQLFNDIELDGETLDGEAMGSFFVAYPVASQDTAQKAAWDAVWDVGIRETDRENTTISSDGVNYYSITGATIQVNSKSMKDPKYFATYSITPTDDGVAKYDTVEELLALQNKDDVFRGSDAESFLETLLSDITIDVNKVESSSNNYSNIATVISTQRTSVSGVDEDEEALNLVKFQNAYNLASKIISVMAEMYDKLIEETGVT